MKLLVFLVLGFVVVVSGFPSERDVESVEDEDKVDIPLPVLPAVAVPAGGVPSYFSFFPDHDLVSRIRGLVARLRTQIGESFSNVQWNKGNTTSTTKVIDGHVVTVNETSYKDDDTDLVLHVKVIDVKPTEGAEGDSDSASPTAEETENVVPSVPNSEDSEGNEIPDKPEEDVAESLPVAYKTQPEETREHLIETREYLSPDYLQDDRPVDEVENTIEVHNTVGEIRPVGFIPIPLHNDINVNKIAGDRGDMVMLPEDVEFFVPDNRDMYTINNNNEYVYNPRSMPIYESIPYERFQHWPRSEKPRSMPVYESIPYESFQHWPRSEKLTRLT